ncbi:F-box protein CPR1-like [Solanum verrucosum]|nr:F-box protein CPR1-like [Solanum verrucosum]
MYPQELAWYDLIKTPEFVQQHLNYSKNNPPQLLLYNSGNLLDDHDSRSITLLSEDIPQTIKGMTYLLGSMDDLFFMTGVIDHMRSCALWNPITRELRPLHLPPPIINHYPVFGLGLDPLTNDYKVVFYLRKNAATIYSCSRDSWRIFKPKKPLPLFIDVKHTFGTAYLNGAYYWLLNGGSHTDYSILSFDFGSEIFEEIEGPDCHCVHSSMLGMMLLDDSIAMLNSNIDERFAYDIWVMIQPAIWNKLVTFQCFPKIKSCYDSSLILATKASRLVSYNVLTNKTRHHGFQRSCLTKHPL